VDAARPRCARLPRGRSAARRAQRRLRRCSAQTRPGQHSGLGCCESRCNTAAPGRNLAIREDSNGARPARSSDEVIHSLARCSAPTQRCYARRVNAHVPSVAQSTSRESRGVLGLDSPLDNLTVLARAAHRRRTQARRRRGRQVRRPLPGFVSTRPPAEKSTKGN